MKGKYIIFANDSPVITFRVITKDHYIDTVEDLTGQDVDLKNYVALEEFETMYFEIEPWYWFSGIRYE